MKLLDKAKQAAEQAATKAKEGVEDVQTKRELNATYGELGTKAFDLVEAAISSTRSSTSSSRRSARSRRSSSRATRRERREHRDAGLDGPAGDAGLERSTAGGGHAFRRPRRLFG